MRTRDKKYQDYEITKENRDFLLTLCRVDDAEVQELVREACAESNDQIAELLFRNLSGGESYDKIDRIPYAQTDFYAYRKKALAIFRDKYIVWLGKGK